MSVHSCVRGRISVHLPEEWRFEVHSCVRGKILVHFFEGWWFRCIHVWGVRFRCIYLRSYYFRAFMCKEYRCIYLRSYDFGAFMCEGQDSGAFTWGTMISVHSCVRDRMLLHLPEEWRFAEDSCVRGKILVLMHLPEEWRFRCFHVWGVRFRCIYLRDDDVRAFMCEG